MGGKVARFLVEIVPMNENWQTFFKSPLVENACAFDVPTLQP